MNVPPVDLKAQYAELADEIGGALKRVCENAWFKLGPEVEGFERDWAAYCEAERCVAVSSGTAALHVALLALDIGDGDDVITSPMSFFATAEAILYTGARPVFADIDPDTFCIGAAGIGPVLTKRTRAVMVVHLFGHPVDMDPILELARSNGLAVIEDAAQAHGALYKGRKVGALGDVGAFSFYVTKNLGAYGEAGAVVTNDPDICERVRLLRAHAEVGPYRHSQVGYNYRMDGIQGAVLNVKLRHLDRWNARRREIAQRYSASLASAPLLVPREAEYARSAWHLYVVRSARRNALREHLEAAGVSTNIHYPVPLPQLEAMRGHELPPPAMPQAEQMAAEALTLPLYPEMSDEQVDYVIQSVKAFF